MKSDDVSGPQKLHLVVTKKVRWNTSDRLKMFFITYLTSWAGLIYEGKYSIVNLLMCIL